MNVFILVFPVLSSFALVSDIKPIEEVVTGFGYDLETHTVETSDGYLLTLHRLLCRSRGSDSDIDRGVPVLVVEGVLVSSAAHLAKSDSIAYSMVDHGFDVWLSNYRGNLYSRNHKTLSPKETAYWNFTLHEMGTADLPAVIDYVLATTRRHSLLYIGFSMGTTMFWVLASTQPHYQAKVAAMVAIGPVARPSNMMGLNNVVTRKAIKHLLSTFLSLNYCEIMGYGEKSASAIHSICTGWFSFLCENFINNLNFFNKQEMAINSVFKLIPYSPAGISTKVLLHFVQIAEAGRFQKFDYGFVRNQWEYQSLQPPKYNLKNIMLPTYFVYSEMDEVATSKDVEWLAQQLAHRPQRRIETVKHFRHSDFTVHKDLETLLTRPLTSLIIELAQEHSTSLARVFRDFTSNIQEKSSALVNPG